MIAPPTEHVPAARQRLKRIGAAGFLFFLVKGLFWLALGVAAYFKT